MTTHPHHTFTPSLWRRIFCSLFLVAAAVALIAAVGSLCAAAEAESARRWHLATRCLAYAKNRAVGDGTHSQRSAGRIFRCAC